MKKSAACLADKKNLKNFIYSYLKPPDRYPDSGLTSPVLAALASTAMHVDVSYKG